PRSQWFGSGLGQSGSTWNAGAVLCSADSAAVHIAATPTAIAALRFMCRPSKKWAQYTPVVIRALLAAALVLLPSVSAAHDIPASIVIQAYVRRGGPFVRLLAGGPG